jgi:hypothetical protein
LTQGLILAQLTALNEGIFLPIVSARRLIDQVTSAASIGNIYVREIST